MKRNSKNLAVIISTLLVIAFICNGYVYADDSSVGVNINNIESESASFRKVITAVFKGDGVVYDKKGLIVTEAFIQKNCKFFEKGDYLSIRSAAENDGIGCIIGDILYGPILPPETGSYEKIAYNFVQQTTAPNQGKTWYFIVTATGQYKYTPNPDGTNTINYFYGPFYSFRFEGEGSMFSGSVISTYSSGVSFNGSNTKANFYIRTTHKMTCNVSSFVSYDLGTYTITNYFTVDLP